MKVARNAVDAVKEYFRYRREEEATALAEQEVIDQACLDTDEHDLQIERDSILDRIALQARYNTWGIETFRQELEHLHYFSVEEIQRLVEDYRRGITRGLGFDDPYYLPDEVDFL